MGLFSKRPDAKEVKVNWLQDIGPIYPNDDYMPHVLIHNPKTKKDGEYIFLFCDNKQEAIAIDGNLMTELNTSTTRYSKFDEHKNNIKKDEEFIPFPGFEFQDCDDPKNKRDYIAKGITRPKLNSDDRKAFSEIKKLLNIRDYNKIDEAIEKTSIFK